MIHSLKTKSEYFEAVDKGEKTFEVRKHDRPYMVNDFLALNETDSDNFYTGRCLIVKVTYILDNADYCKDGFVVIGIEPCRISDRSGRMSHNFEFCKGDNANIYDRS